MGRETTTGLVIEEMVLPALRRCGYQAPPRSLLQLLVCKKVLDCRDFFEARSFKLARRRSACGQSNNARHWIAGLVLQRPDLEAAPSSRKPA